MNDNFQELITSVISGTDSNETRERFREHFSSEIQAFTANMEIAFDAWVNLDAILASNTRGAHITALVYGALNTQVISMKLFVEGLLVAAGNSQRYVLESIAMAFLAASAKHDYYDRYSKGIYTTNNAIRDLKRKASELGVIGAGAQQLQDHSKFYDQYSHPSLLTTSSLMTLDEANPRTIFGSAFDEAKLDAYEKEVKSRVSLSSVFPNFIQGVGEIYERAA